MKKALLVGINDYPGTFNDLMGCVNDVQNMCGALTSYFGFAKENINILIDRDATTFNILKALEMLVYEAKPGDFLVFHYSGHGSQVPDTNGDEKDRLDEIICPCDLDWRSKVIRDDDLSKVFEPVPAGVHIEVILDSCHSGTGLRTAGGAYCRQRFLPMPEEIMVKVGEQRKVTPIKPERIQVLWAACRANQFAADAYFGGKYGGAFTTSLCESLAASKGQIGRYDLLKSVQEKLKKGGFNQVPQLETARKLKKALFLG